MTETQPTATQLLEAANNILSSGDGQYAGDSYYSDEVILARHIEATVRRDDDEPVSEERLTALLGYAKPGWGWKLSNDLSIWNSRKGFGVSFTGGEGDANPVRLFALATMKDVRALCHALGIPLQPQDTE